MNAQEQLRIAEVFVAVFGKADDFVLVPINAGNMDESAIEAAIDKGYEFCGVMGWKDGQAGAKCQPGSNAFVTMMRASPAFARYVAEASSPTPAGDAVEWLEKLYSLTSETYAETSAR